MHALWAITTAAAAATTTTTTAYNWKWIFALRYALIENAFRMYNMHNGNSSYEKSNKNTMDLNRFPSSASIYAFRPRSYIIWAKIFVYCFITMYRNTFFFFFYYYYYRIYIPASRPTNCLKVQKQINISILTTWSYSTSRLDEKPIDRC